MGPEEDQLAAIRARIDALDEQLQQLISERAACAKEVAGLKRAGNAEEESYYRPEREAQVLRQVVARNRGPLPDQRIVGLFREIMSACLALQQPLKVAFLGPYGTFTQTALYKHFGHGVGVVPLGSVEEVFREVEAGAAHFGVVPVENSTEGVVTYTLDRFVLSPLKICGEVELRIHHHLLGKGESLPQFVRVYSHHQSLAQCREWLQTHLAGVDQIPVSSNAEAARRAAEESGSGAIAGTTAAEIYGLSILAANIEDEPNNTTRFLVIGRQESRPSGDDKTSLLVSTANRPGGLYQLLAPFARCGISMTRIESRPSRRGIWDYLFFIDIEGHSADPAVAEALGDLAGQASVLKVLGSYPRAVA
jgi:chorismate mutase / prephenate dehydratase